MPQLTGQKEDATLNTQSYVSETDKESYLTESKKIEGTPFIMRRIEEKWFITCGDTRITEWTYTEQEQIDKLENEKWMIITMLIIHLCKLDKLTAAANELP